MGRDTKKHIKLVIFIIIGFFAARILFSFLHFSPIIFQLLFNKNIELRKTQDQRINILLLGIGGGTHDGPDLTDTIIFASLDPQKDKVALISVPRDLWVPDLQGKINEAYADGEGKKKGGGLIESEAAVSKILGQSIDYGIRIDFQGFVKAVDSVGGLDINVDNTFDDYQYPIEGKEDDTCGHSTEELQALATASADLQFDQLSCRYKHIHFEKGNQHLNGEQALEYVRSRHALGDEGTDFARSKRQQKIISSLKEKFISAQTILNPARVLNLFTIIKGSINTDIKEDEYDDFIKLAQKMKGAKIASGVLDLGDDTTGRQGLLINPPITSVYNFEWVLIPKNGENNFKEIQNYTNCMIQRQACDVFNKKTK